MTATVIAAPGPELDAVYRRLLVPSFPARELIGLDDLASGVRRGSVVVLVPATPGAPVAVAVGERFGPPEVVLLSYLAVDPAHRGRGAGGVLLDDAVAAWRGSAVLVLAEVEHPFTAPTTDARGDPRRRLAFYGRHGARVLDLPFLQPELRPGAGRVEGMLLLALHVDAAQTTSEGTLRAEPVQAFLAEYFRRAEGAVPVDPAARILLDRAGGRAGVRLLDPGDVGALPGSPP